MLAQQPQQLPDELLRLFDGRVVQPRRERVFPLGRGRGKPREGALPCGREFGIR
jgi:hypothetical protein